MADNCFLGKFEVGLEAWATKFPWIAIFLTRGFFGASVAGRLTNFLPDHRELSPLRGTLAPFALAGAETADLPRGPLWPLRIKPEE